MHKPPAHLIEAVEHAAELRAASHGWEHVAKELGRPYCTIRCWPRMYREFWDQLLLIFGKSLSIEVRTEALGCLRKLLRSEDEKVCHNAAKELIAATDRASVSGNPETAAVSDFCRFAARLEDMSDDELAKLLDEYRRRDVERRDLCPRTESDSDGSN